MRFRKKDSARPLYMFRDHDCCSCEFAGGRVRPTVLTTSPQAESSVILLQPPLPLAGAPKVTESRESAKPLTTLVGGPLPAARAAEHLRPPRCLLWANLLTLY